MDGLTAARCPDDIVCRSICLGPLDGMENRRPEDLEQWGHHVEKCVSCQDRMERIFDEFCARDPILRILPRQREGRGFRPA